MEPTIAHRPLAPDVTSAVPVVQSPAESDDLLIRVTTALKERRGKLREIARTSGMSYDTVRRIKNGENDPSYGKVKLLAAVLGV